MCHARHLLIVFTLTMLGGSVLAQQRSLPLPTLPDDALMKTHLARLRQFAAQRVADGGLLIDSKPYNEYAY